MKKSKLLAAALAATMFATAACGLVACGDNVDSGKTYTVTFDADGGTLDGEQSLKTDKNGIVKGAIPTAEKVDYTFTGWSLSKGDTAVINFKSQKFTGDKTVYAVYESNGVSEVTITFEYGDGTGTLASAQTVNGKLQSLPTPTPPQDQMFDGWYTAAVGGEYVTTNTLFTQSGSIYARYKSTIAELNNYCMVGNDKYTLTATTLAGATQAYSVSVELNAGDTVSFYIDAELIEAQRGDVWIGMEKVSVITSEFTAARQGTFEFKLGYYPASVGTEDTWRVEGDDGVIAFHADHYYFVGGDYGWEECSVDGYVGETFGSFELTVGESPVAFKLAKCSSAKLGTILWDDSVLGINAVAETGSGYASTDGSSNIVLTLPGTYTIRLVNGQVEISSDDVEEPPVTIFARHYYLVGGDLGWTACVEDGYIGETSGEIEVTVGEDPVRFKLVKCANVAGAIDWDSALGANDVATTGRGYVTTDNDGNIVLETPGTYTIRLVNGQIEITSDDVEEPVITYTKEIEGYTYGAVDSTKYYLVGGFIGEEFDADNGYEMLQNPDNSYEYVVIGFTVEAGGAVKIVFGDNEYGYANIDADWGNKDWAETDADGNIVFKKFGTYKIFFSTTDGKIYLNK
ncbi:MAG: InlB B-repeat-containing protein [Clostridiales bacterium]|nr:InlB B-repeat-containing protein [Clostridiales bacterium]